MQKRRQGRKPKSCRLANDHRSLNYSGAENFALQNQLTEYENKIKATTRNAETSMAKGNGSRSAAVRLLREAISARLYGSDSKIEGVRHRDDRALFLLYCARDCVER